MQTTVSEEILGLKFIYFINDCMASSCVGLKKEWEPHITKFTQLYNKLYKIENIIDIGAILYNKLYKIENIIDIGTNFGYHTLLFSRECNENV